MSPLSPSNANLAMLQMDQQDMIQKRLDMDALRARLNGEPDKKAKLREACEGFESVFIQKMWEQMRKNVQKSGYLHSKDEQMYQGMYDAEFSKKMTQAGGIGLADMLYEQLSQRLGESSRSASPGVSPRLPILPAGGSMTGLGAQIQPLAGPDVAAGQKGIALNQSNVRPLYEDAPAHVAAQAQLKEASGALSGYEENTGDLTRQGGAEAGPELVPYEEELDFEELSQSLLSEELASGISVTSAAEPVLSSTQPVLTPEEAALIAAALRQNMADAGRISMAQAPAARGRHVAFGTAFAKDTAKAADSAAAIDTNQLPRS